MTYDPTDWGDQAIEWVAKAISRYRYNPGYQWPDMSEKARDWLRGEAKVAIEAVRETEIYALWQVPTGTRTVGWGMTAKADRSAKRQDPQGLGPKGESGGRAAICPNDTGV